MYELVVTSAHIPEPVTLEEARKHLRVDHTDDDALIGALITAAREYAEDALCWRALTPRGYDVTFDGWPSSNQLWLPMPPVMTVDEIVSIDGEGAEETIDPARYRLDSGLGRVVFVGYHPGASRVRVSYQAGYMACPASLRAGVLLLVGHWYENREEVVVGAGVVTATVPSAAQAILVGSRAWRPEAL